MKTRKQYVENRMYEAATELLSDKPMTDSDVFVNAKVLAAFVLEWFAIKEEA